MMETNIHRDRGSLLPQQNWNYPRNNLFEQQEDLLRPILDTGHSWRLKSRITSQAPNQRWNMGYQHPLDNTMSLNRNTPWSRGKDLNWWSPNAVQTDWNREPVFPRDPPIQHNNQWSFMGNKAPWYPAVDKGPWTPRQDFNGSPNGFKSNLLSDQCFQDNMPSSKYRRESESNRGMMQSACYPGVDYSHQRPPRREPRFERESRKDHVFTDPLLASSATLPATDRQKHVPVKSQGYESHNRHRRPNFYKPEKKRHHNAWAREAAEALKEEKPSKFKEQQPSTVSGPRVEIQYCSKKCRASKLHEAINNGDLEKVNDILNQPTVELEERDDIFWETPLMWATRLGKQEIMKAVLDKGASPWVASKDGATLLHLAVLSGIVEIVKYIKEATQIDTDHQDKSGKTALMLAAQRGNLEMVKYLIDKGANTELRSKKKANILLLAAESGNAELVKYILDNTQLARNINCLNTDEHTPLMLAAGAGFAEICRLLIQHGANCNVVDPEGRTPLHAATEKGYSEVVDCLLEQNLVLHTQDRSGKTPVQLAVCCKHIPIALSLLEKGASMDIPDRKGRSVLHMAAENGQMEIFRYLEKCNRKGDFQARTKQCWHTPIHCAAKAGHLNVVQWLIQQGVDPNITDRDLNTPLHSAALVGHLELVKFLVGAKANINQRNKGGETPLHFAAMWNHLSVVEYLCEKGADVNVRDTWGQTALQVAQKGNCSEATKYLEQKQTSQEVPK